MKTAASREPNSLNPSSMRSMKRRNLASSCENLTDMRMSQMTLLMETANTGLRSTGLFFWALRTQRNSSTSFMMRLSIWDFLEPTVVIPKYLSPSWRNRRWSFHSLPVVFITPEGRKRSVFRRSSKNWVISRGVPRSLLLPLRSQGWPSPNVCQTHRIRRVCS